MAAKVAAEAWVEAGWGRGSCCAGLRFFALGFGLMQNVDFSRPKGGNTADDHHHDSRYHRSRAAPTDSAAGWVRKVLFPSRSRSLFDDFSANLQASNTTAATTADRDPGHDTKR